MQLGDQTAAAAATEDHRYTLPSATAESSKSSESFDCSLEAWKYVIGNLIETLKGMIG